MIRHSDITDKELVGLIKINKVQWGGNRRLKIYGLLTCKSGRRMNRENRVFFEDENDAIKAGFRPCKNCCRNRFF